MAVSYYLPDSAKDGNVPFSIPAYGALPIGFGDSGTYPKRYTLKPNQDVDVGFMKLYLSTTYVDYSSIAQESPFRKDRATQDVVPKRSHRWDSIMVPIVQKRRIKGSGITS